MLTKTVDPSARIAEKRIVCLAALVAALLAAFVLAGRAAADVPVGAALASAASVGDAGQPAGPAAVAAVASAGKPAIASAGAAAGPAGPPGGPKGDSATEVAATSLAHVTSSVGTTATQGAATLAAAPAIHTVASTAASAVPLIKTVSGAGGGRIVAPVLGTAIQGVRGALGAVVQPLAHGAGSLTGSLKGTVSAGGTTLGSTVGKLPGGASRPVVRYAGHSGRWGSGPAASVGSGVPPGLRSRPAGPLSLTPSQHPARAGAQAGRGRDVATSLSVDPRGALAGPDASLAGAAGGSRSSGSHISTAHAVAGGIRAPGPAPDGLGGPNAAGAGPGASILIGLLGLLLLAAPRLCRRLRLRRDPWPMPPCIATPERPG
jgi:hypothetical protein